MSRSKAMPSASLLQATLSNDTGLGEPSGSVMVLAAVVSWWPSSEPSPGTQWLLPQEDNYGKTCCRWFKGLQAGGHLRLLGSL